MRKFTIGDVALYALDDGTFPFPAHYFFANVAEPLWRTELDVDARGKIPVGHNYAAVQTRDALVVIDTGYGDDTHGGRTGHMLEEFDRAGLRRDEVTHVVATHAHGDHIKRHTLRSGGERVPTFPRARYCLARADWEWFAGPGHAPEFDEQLVTLHRLRRLHLYCSETALAHGLRLLPTPGHTPGHTSVLIESQGETALYLGDVCHLPAHFAHPDWVSTFDTHPALTPATRRRVLDLAVARDALTLCPHAPSPGTGRVRRAGAGYCWEPVA